MKKSLITLGLGLFINLLYSQNPLVKQWDYSFGGDNIDALNSFEQTADGGYILGGWTASDSSGDISQHMRGGEDYWIVKIDSLGNKQWEKRFGGTRSEQLYAVHQTNDHGYILGGLSSSEIGGDKTQPNWDTTGFTCDYWIVKTDSVGNKLWDKSFGGLSNDQLFTVQQTKDGGYILGGGSVSSAGGDKTQLSKGYWDYWIVKTDSAGNKQWDKDYGGLNLEVFTSLQQTDDGGYIVGGYSNSDTTGDKSQMCWGVVDYWIIKTDAFGIKQWDKRFGGLLEDRLEIIQQTSDKGYILGGFSRSDSSGDKTVALLDTPAFGGADFWVVKINSSGIKQWDKKFGGLSVEDKFNSIAQTSDGGYLFGGTSFSNICGDKTENNLGPYQSWFVKSDSVGNKQWDKTLRNEFSNGIGIAIQTSDGCYAMANSSSGGIAGDKTQMSQGADDFWIIKFCDSTLATNVNEFSASHFQVSIFPNPFISDITIGIKKQNIGRVTYAIKDILGQIILSDQEVNLSDSFLKTISLNALAEGIYFLDVSIDGERRVSKIVKQ